MKPLFVSIVALLRLFFTSITLKLEIAVGHLSCFHFECQDSTSYKVTEEMLNLLTMGMTARGRAWYTKRANQGMNLLNVEKFVEEETDLVELISFIDYFIGSAFFQLTTSEKLVSFLTRRQTNLALMEVSDLKFSILFESFRIYTKLVHK
ncbi:hypothetical protein OESDEN_13737 [Oesophagostomum dentatum]|uniref:Uncharacterized protein n=1 Tax=Oesophagostomum dentatum TaxID=61180 RepID=A0A0B1SME7_OESDE|nr:hypothetical protein OESDEN_13737 [Oesophagostomum dentatum]